MKKRFLNREEKQYRIRASAAVPAGQLWAHVHGETAPLSKPQRLHYPSREAGAASRRLHPVTRLVTPQGRQVARDIPGGCTWVQLEECLYLELASRSSSAWCASPKMPISRTVRQDRETATRDEQRDTRGSTEYLGTSTPTFID